MKSKHPNPNQPVKLSAKQGELKLVQDLLIFNQWHLCQLSLCNFHEWLLEQLYTHSTQWDTAAKGKFPLCFHKKNHMYVCGDERGSTDSL